MWCYPMPIAFVASAPLKNTRHELFAQALAGGKTGDAAYQAAGYKPHRGNACGFRFNPAGCSDMKPAGIPI